jgi:hypothetical protein
MLGGLWRGEGETRYFPTYQDVRNIPNRGGMPVGMTDDRMGLALLLIPLLPGVINSVLAIYDAIAAHPDTPAAQKAQLDAISAGLRVVAAQVAAVKLPDEVA